MPRARNIKHGFFTNDELADNDPLGRLLFIGLWTIADYKGDLEWNPRRIKVQLLPYDDCDIVSLAINLDKSGFIRFYSVQGRIYLRVVNFTLHQNPHKNERQQGSDIPEFSEESRQVIDFETLTINRDLSRLNQDQNETDRADSLFLIPDSLSLNPEKEHCASGDTQRVRTNETAKRSSSQADRFQRFWEAYPLKKSKGQAESAFAKINPDDLMLNRMIKAIHLQIAHRKKLQEAGQFVPEIKHPSTWLRAKAWEDELETIQQRPLAGTYLSAVGSPSPTPSLKDFEFED